MPVLVFGATSQIGHFLLPRLRREGVDVHALSRGAHAAVAGVHWHRGALPDRVPALPAMDAILGFGPLDGLAHWLSTLPRPPAGAAVATSSMSALSKQHSPLAEDRALSEALRRNEAAFRRECERLGMAWTLIRPTLIYGAGRDRSLSPIARRALRWRVFPLPRARGLRQPVHAADLADAAWRALRTPQARGRIFELGGGERLPARTMFARVRASLPVATLPLPLGAVPMRVLALAMPAARGAIRRLDHDLVADNRDAEAVLGVRPRGFAPDAGCWGLAAPAGGGA